MKTEAATVIIIELASITFVFLFLPMVVILASLQSVWNTNKAVGLLLGIIFALTGILFILYFGGLIALTFSGATVKS